MVNAEADIVAVVNVAAMAAIRGHLTKGEVEDKRQKQNILTKEWIVNIS